MAELAVETDGAKIKTGSVGSCVVIAIYDPIAGVGGLAHAMLPSAGDDPPGGGVYESEAKYADRSVDNLLRRIEAAGGSRKNLKAKLVGGAMMFKILGGDQYGIGHQNVSAARRRLGELGIPIESEDVGGSAGRIVELTVGSGLIEVSTKL